ncbi:hypothetical protein [endosymbiont DhMRE of Dentiscutata heterogama]|uniref:hypothetical protein n=1 Tax=endosymbiont DhMRE of Dentiscutata heterogama TaxID=1609546 RepID=UPI002AD3BB36|nr:hypothetical protein [endosymbiont DhMRE of Dentiscutata heterogama]
MEKKLSGDKKLITSSGLETCDQCGKKLLENDVTHELKINWGNEQSKLDEGIEWIYGDCALKYDVEEV